MEIENMNLVNNSGGMNPPKNMPIMNPPKNMPIMNPSNNMPGMNQEQSKCMMKYQMVYPEIFYKLQPYIMMVCDQMDYCSIMPSMEMVQQMTDNIYNDVCRMYPDLAEYARNNATTSVADPPPFDRDSGMFGQRFRRRGMFKDVIDILLLSELFGRRRRFF